MLGSVEVREEAIPRFGGDRLKRRRASLRASVSSDRRAQGQPTFESAQPTHRLATARKKPSRAV
jgi:hypothetical protein